MVEAVHANLDAIHRYVALRQKVLGIEDYHIYDMYVPIVAEGKASYTFDEGWAMAMEFWTETFGEEYAAVAERGRNERWIDVYASTGKRGGAYSWGSYNSHPYLFLNWGGKLEDVFTLVHEMGHSIHTYLANARTALPPVELLALCRRDRFGGLGVALLRVDARPRRRPPKTAGVAQPPAQQHHRAPSCGSSSSTSSKPRPTPWPNAASPSPRPRWARSGAISGPPTTDPDVTLDEVYKSGWARIPHFYRTFYVWKYASSFAAGEAIAGRFRSGDKTAVDDYLACLKLGGSVYPMDAIKRAGVDLTDPEVMGTVMVRWNEILDEMEGLLLAE